MPRFVSAVYRSQESGPDCVAGSIETNWIRAPLVSNGGPIFPPQQTLLRETGRVSPVSVSRTIYGTASAHILLIATLSLERGLWLVSRSWSSSSSMPPWQSGPRDRHAFLEKVCGGDLEFRRSVEYLLVKDPRAGSSPHNPPPGFLDKTTVDIRKDLRDSSQTSRDSDQVRPPVDPQSRPRPGAVLGGRFLVVRFITRGGMGEVYEVENLHLQGVHIALKPFSRRSPANPTPNWLSPTPANTACFATRDTQSGASMPKKQRTLAPLRLLDSSAASSGPRG
jgi:hypothetical protein